MPAAEGAWLNSSKCGQAHLEKERSLVVMGREQVKTKHRQGRGWDQGVKTFQGARQEEMEGI